MINDKIFRTHDELIQSLKLRGIDISSPSDKDYALQVLSQIGYYNLVNGYNKLFLLNPSSDDDKYKQGTTLKEIHALYQFDKSLRSIFMKYLLSIETHVKSLISYYFSEQHGHKNYLIYSNFNTSIRNSHNQIPSLIAGIQSQMASRSSDPSIEHYLKTYGYVPLWVVNNVLTFGTISKFYRLMNTKERQSVSKSFNLLDNELENCLYYLSNVRNFCAHDNRLYCYRSTKPIIDTKYHESLKIQKSDSGEYICGKRDLFAAFISMKLLLSKNDIKRMSKDIYRNLGILYNKLSVLTRDDILDSMGFPQNWKYIEKL
ncbi:MAG: Abi family protein [Anaerostipes sp.]|nr:Abi family protein [Anaerostipes sp.]